MEVLEGLIMLGKTIIVLLCFIIVLIIIGLIMKSLD
jgi:hypothetical protein